MGTHPPPLCRRVCVVPPQAHPRVWGYARSGLIPPPPPAVIQTGLREINNLTPVSHSLLRLVITEQKISRIENLHLPNLRDLLLHCNEIVRIEGLSHCPRLQRLWLFSNRIAKIENLDGLPDLRELWLQV